MKCKSCRQDIPDGSSFCCHCGRKQAPGKAKPRTHKRASGSGTITQDKRYKKPWIAYAPSTRYGTGRVYIGAFSTRREAQDALDAYIREGRPELYHATFAQVYELWSSAHFKRVSDSAVALYTSMWKRFAPLYGMKMRELRTAHFQEIVSAATSRSAAETLKAMAYMICKYAAENDIVTKNYAEYIKVPKFEKKVKRIFTPEEIAQLWKHSDREPVRVVLFMIYTGFRIGEVLQLTAASVHLDEGYIVGGEKTDAGRDRIVPLPPRIPELSDWVREWTERAGAERLFPVSAQYFRRRIFHDALQAADITPDGLTPHSTRHTFASLSSAAGMKPENLQKIIGHADFSTTSGIYIHQNLDTLRAEMEKIAR